MGLVAALSTIVCVLLNVNKKIFMDWNHPPPPSLPLSASSLHLINYSFAFLGSTSDSSRTKSTELQHEKSEDAHDSKSSKVEDNTVVDEEKPKAEEEKNDLAARRAERRERRRQSATALEGNTDESADALAARRTSLAARRAERRQRSN